MLEREQVEIREERSARRAPLADAEVRALLTAVDTVILARGKRAEHRLATQVVPDDLRGPTGNFRAPLLRQGRTLLVGFHPASLAALL